MFIGKNITHMFGLEPVIFPNRDINIIHISEMSVIVSVHSLTVGCKTNEI